MNDEFIDRYPDLEEFGSDYGLAILHYLGTVTAFLFERKIATISICHTGRKKSEIRSDDFVFLDVSKHSVKKIWIKTQGLEEGRVGYLEGGGEGRWTVRSPQVIIMIFMIITISTGKIIIIMGTKLCPSLLITRRLREATST